MRALIAALALLPGLAWGQAPTLPTLPAQSVSARALRAGAWEKPAGLTATSSYTISNGRLFAAPIDILAPATLDRIGVVLSAAAPSAMNVRMGLYADNGGMPGALLVDGGTVPIASGATGQVLATISYQVTSPRRLWAAAMTDTSTPMFGMFGYPLDLPMSVPVGATGWQSQGWTVAGQTFGALPASPAWTRNDQTANSPAISVRVGSLP